LTDILPGPGGKTTPEPLPRAGQSTDARKTQDDPRKSSLPQTSSDCEAGFWVDQRGGGIQEVQLKEPGEGEQGMGSDGYGHQLEALECNRVLAMRLPQGMDRPTQGRCHALVEALSGARFPVDSPSRRR